MVAHIVIPPLISPFTTVMTCAAFDIHVVTQLCATGMISLILDMLVHVGQVYLMQFVISECFVSGYPVCPKSHMDKN